MKPSEMVGATGFEPATPCAQGRCATRLRYAPTPNIHDFTAVFCRSLPRVLRFWGENCPELSQKSARLSQNTPDSSARLSQNSRRLVRRAIELLERLALHLQLHLRVLVEHLRIACRSSCVTHSSATPPALRRVA